MTDWNEIVDNIERAMHASTAFQEAGKALVDEAEAARIQAFALRMEELQFELARIYKLIGPASPVALDEIIDAFSQAARGKHAAYRLTPEPTRHKTTA